MNTDVGASASLPLMGRDCGWGDGSYRAVGKRLPWGRRPYFKNGSSGPMGMIRVGLMVGWLQ